MEVVAMGGGLVAGLGPCVSSSSSSASCWAPSPHGGLRIPTTFHARDGVPHCPALPGRARRKLCGNREKGEEEGLGCSAVGSGIETVSFSRGRDGKSVASKIRSRGRVHASSNSTNGLLADTAQTFSTEEVLPRQAHVSRVTKETSVDVHLNLDGSGISSSDTGIPFLDHMLDQIASHGLVDVKVIAKGDIHIDDHHTNEDIGLAVGTALLQALGDRKGIFRFGDFSAPLDEALVHVVLDLSGRPYLGYDLNIPTQRVGTYDTQLVEHFFQSVVNTSGMTLHIRQLAGKNSHHIIEATFKAFARALRQAMEYDTRRKGTIPSSKGLLSRA